ncbi:DHHW family protein, partial [Klebsiella pneumoniae]|uniref:DHHW family protein n=1 Tax=Klebsiella pneumoniae TaxID=573 RepID=UPI003AF80D92
KILTISLFAAFLALFAAVHLALPDRAFSPLENRTLAQRPAFTVDGLLDGSFTADVETYIADQFPLRDGLTALKAACERL